MRQIIILLSIIALCSADFVSDCVNAQNGYRGQYGENGFNWADDLAASAQNWANNLANTNSFYHSGTDGVGENLAAGTSGYYDTNALVKMWGDEGQYFIQGCTFPDCSTTGNWEDVGHYTQMVWRNTNEVGCGIASGNGMDYLVCQYRPPGNYMGQGVF